MAKHLHWTHSSSAEELESCQITAISTSTLRSLGRNFDETFRKLGNKTNNDERGDKPSASGAEAYSLCKAKFALEKGMPDTSNEASKMGDRIHQWLEGENEIALTVGELELAKRCEDQRSQLLSLFFPDWQDHPISIIKEQRLWFGRRRMSGKADFIGIKGKTAIVLDYKTGRSPVTASKDNKQLLWLAVLVAENYMVDEVIVGVIQPLCEESRTHRYTREELTVARVGITKILRTLEKGVAKPTPGEKQCQYCRAKQVCPALNKAAVEVVKPLELTPALVTQQLSVVLALEEWCVAVKAKAKEMLIADPKSIPQYTLRQGGVRRFITDNVMATERLVDAGLFTANEIVGMASISISALEKALIDFGGSRPDARRSINTVLAGLIKEKQGEPQLMGVKS